MAKPTLNELSAFIAVAEHRSFRKAADAIGMSRSALSHALLRLEQDFGVRLLNRTTRTVSLTQAGAQLLAGIRPVLQDLDTAMGSPRCGARRQERCGSMRTSGQHGCCSETSFRDFS